MERYTDLGRYGMNELTTGTWVKYDSALALIREAYNEAWNWAGTYDTDALRDKARERWIRENVTGEGK